MSRRRETHCWRRKKGVNEKNRVNLSAKDVRKEGLQDVRPDVAQGARIMRIRIDDALLLEIVCNLCARAVVGVES